MEARPKGLEQRQRQEEEKRNSSLFPHHHHRSESQTAAAVIQQPAVEQEQQIQGVSAIPPPPSEGSSSTRAASALDQYKLVKVVFVMGHGRGRQQHRICETEPRQRRCVSNATQRQTRFRIIPVQAALQVTVRLMEKAQHTYERNHQLQHGT